MKRAELKNKKREEARERLALRIQRTPREQLALIATRPGQSRKETAKLLSAIDLGYGNTRGPRQFSNQPK